MTEQLDFESDPLAKLLSDALRAGPGSPQWHDAASRLAGDGSAQASEYRQVLEARQRLESGRNYRSVRAGPGFTRRLMDSLESEPAGNSLGRLLPPAGAVAVVSALLVVAALVGMAYYLLPRTPAPNTNGIASGSPGIDRLASLYLVDTVTAASFDGGGEAPSGWRTIGSLRMTYARGLRPAPAGAGMASSAPMTQPAAGGIVWGQPLDPNEPLAIEATLRAPRAIDEIIPEIVVAEQEPLDRDTATATRELVWLLRDGKWSLVLPGGDVVEAPTQRHREVGQQVVVRLTFDRSNAILEINGARAWAGEHKLSPDKPRFAALRFLKRGSSDRGAEVISFQSVRLQRPSPQNQPAAR
jgi:hypothetical protein